ncbi:MAG: hypothetical protein JW807_08620 [Spirochaetes bacterium]|nr:hypothetical protein [Spirochaetota bacterium]
MKKYIPVLIALFFFLTGCESAVYRLLYNSLDSLIYRSVARYIDPGPDQERFLKDKIDFHLGWHRRDQLAKYSETMRGLRERMAAGIKKSDIAWVKARFERHSEEMYNRISDDIAAFLASLKGDQVDHMERMMSERRAEVEKKSKRNARNHYGEMRKFIAKILEFIYGPLTRQQEAEIARGVRQMKNLDPVRMRLYRERQGEFIAFMRKGPGRQAIRKYLRRFFVKPEQYYPAYYRAPAERQDRTIEEAFVRFDREMVTPGQRAHALRKIDMLIRTLGELAAEKP